MCQERQHSYINVKKSSKLLVYLSYEQDIINGKIVNIFNDWIRKKMFYKVLEFILYDSILTKNIKTYQTTPSIVFGKDKWIATYFS